MNEASFKSLACGRQGVERSGIRLILLLLSLLLFEGRAQASDYETAHRLIQKKNWAEALPLLEVLHREAPNSALVAQDLAQALLRMNRRAEAMRILRKFSYLRQAEIAGRTFAHQESYRLYQEGLNFLEDQKLALARDRFEKAHERDRDQLEIMMRMIQVETLDHRTDAALGWVRATRELHRDSPELLLWEGRALSLQKRYTEAVKKLTLAARDLPASQNAALWLGEGIYGTKDSDAARLSLEADLKVNPLHLRVMLRRIQWSLDRFNLEAAEPADIEKELKTFQTRLEKAGTEKLPRFESEIGLEIIDLEQLRDEFGLLQTRFEELKKRSAL